MSVKDKFDQFKLYVSGLEYSPDTVALDRALGEATNMCLDIRLEIDIEWAQARALARRSLFLDKFSDDELTEALAVIQGHKGVSDENSR